VTGVTIAARMESLAAPGGIHVSRAVRDQVRDQPPILFEDFGEHEIKNISRPVRVFRIALEERATGPAAALRRKTPTPPDKLRGVGATMMIVSARLRTYAAALQSCSLAVHASRCLTRKRVSR
jgi:hypothetical protein